MPDLHLICSTGSQSVSSIIYGFGHGLQSDCGSNTPATSKTIFLFVNYQNSCIPLGNVDDAMPEQPHVPWDTVFWFRGSGYEKKSPRQSGECRGRDGLKEALLNTSVNVLYFN